MQAALSALQCADSVIYTDITDKPFFASQGKPALWQPFGVDDTVFQVVTPFHKRKIKPFFRGKATPF